MGGKPAASTLHDRVDPQLLASVPGRGRVSLADHGIEETSRVCASVRVCVRVFALTRCDAMRCAVVDPTASKPRGRLHDAAPGLTPSLTLSPLSLPLPHSRTHTHARAAGGSLRRPAGRRKPS